MREALPTDASQTSPQPSYTRAHDARAHARSAPGRRAAVAPGPAVRAAADSSIAAQLGAAQNALRAAVMVRIERLRPHWCAGWLEDFALADGNLRALLPYLRDEWGGQEYRLTVMGPDNVAISDHVQPIAGAPRDLGRVIDRDAWEGRAPVATAQPVAAPIVAPVVQAAPGTELLNTVLGMMRDANAAQFKAVQEMRAADSRQTAELIASINRRNENGDRPKGPTFAQQIGEVIESANAINHMREALTIDAPPREQPTETDDGLTKEAMRAFMSKAFGGPQLVPHPTQSSEGRAQQTQQRRPDLREATTEPVPIRPAPKGRA